MLSEFRHAFYVQPMPMVYNEVMTGYTLWWYGTLVLRGKGRRAAGWLLLGVSVAVIVVFTLAERQITYVPPSFEPLITFRLAQEEPELYRALQMNVFLFMPFGMALPFALPERMKLKILFTVLTGAVISAAIEGCQLYYGIGKCETDDVLMNTLGAAAGATAYALNTLLRRWYRRRVRQNQ